MKAERNEERHSGVFDVISALDICARGAEIMEKLEREEEKKKEAKTKRGKRTFNNQHKINKDKGEDMKAE